MLGAFLDRNFQYPLRGSFGYDSSVVVGQGTLSQIVVVRLQDVSMYLHRCLDVGVVPMAKHYTRR